MTVINHTKKELKIFSSKVPSMVCAEYNEWFTENGKEIIVVQEESRLVVEGSCPTYAVFVYYRQEKTK
jgi:hypothetical protein